MMLAMIFPTRQEADQGAERVEAWAATNLTGKYISMPVPYKGQWAVTVPDGYPCEGTVDVNAVDAEQEER